MATVTLTINHTMSEQSLRTLASRLEAYDQTEKEIQEVLAEIPTGKEYATKEQAAKLRRLRKTMASLLREVMVLIQPTPSQIRALTYISRDPLNFD